MNEEGPRLGTWGKVLLIGCGGGLALLVLAVVLIVSNLDKIKDSPVGRAVTEGVEIFSEAREFNAVLEEEFPGFDFETTFSMEHDDGVSRKSLTIIVLNAPEVDDAAVEGTARSVAVFTKEHFTDVARFDTILVTFTKRTGIVGFETSRSYSFPIDEL